MHPTHISNIEHGKVSASAYGFYRIAEALGIKLVDLLGMIDNGENLGFESDLVDITGSIRQMNDIHRGLYIAAIKGMIPK